MHSPAAVSVVMPTYNRGQLLREAVGSVMRQTFTDWELILVDDGSTDETPELVAGLRDSRIVNLRATHSGNPARVRNTGIARARGEWVAFLDSDDLWLPEKLERQLAALASHPRYQWSCTGFTFIDAVGASTLQHAGEPYRAQSGWILEQLLRFTATASVTTLMVRRSLLDDIGGFDETLLSREDYDLMLRLAARAEIWALDEPLTVIREHVGRTTKGWAVSDLYRYNERVFRKAAASASGRRVRSICRRQCAGQLVAQARALLGESDRPGAALAALRAMRDAPLSPRVWRGAGGCIWHAVAGRGLG